MGFLGRAATSRGGPSSVTAPAATSTQQGWRRRGRGRTGVCQTVQNPGQPFAVGPGSSWHESPEGVGHGDEPGTAKLGSAAVLSAPGGCADAYVLLAEHARSRKKPLALDRRGLA